MNIHAKKIFLIELFRFKICCRNCWKLKKFYFYFSHYYSLIGPRSSIHDGHTNTQEFVQVLYRSELSRLTNFLFGLLVCVKSRRGDTSSNMFNLFPRIGLSACDPDHSLLSSFSYTMQRSRARRPRHLYFTPQQNVDYHFQIRWPRQTPQANRQDRVRIVYRKCESNPMALARLS